MEYLLLALVFIPLCMGAMLFLAKDEEILWRLAVLGAVCMLGLSGFLFAQGGTLEIHLPYFSHLGIGFQSNAFGKLYGFLICILWLISIVSSKEYFGSHGGNLSQYYGTLFLTLAGCLGVFYAQDLFTLFIFFEIMSFSSYFWVLHTGTDASLSASRLYLTFAIGGGMVLLLGIVSLAGVVGNLNISALKDLFSQGELGQQALLPSMFLFFGFGAKAGIFLLHDWLPLAHTVSPAPASALLSGVLTKCGIYGIVLVLLKITAGIVEFSAFVLLIALLTMMFGAFCAFMSGNLKRTLAFSTVSQMGFILWGLAFTTLLADHNSVPTYGALYHMINHSIIKVLLFCCAGIVYQNTHTLDLSDLRGFGKGKPWFQALFTVGACSLAGVPLFSGYISKTLLHEAVVEYLHLNEGASHLFYVYEWLFLITGGFTVAYLLKLYHCLFFAESEDDEDHEGEYEDWETGYASYPTLIALSILGIALVVLGTTPQITFAYLGDFSAEFLETHHLPEISFFSLTNLRGALISFAIGFAVFFQHHLHCRNNESDEFTERMREEDTFVNKLYLPMGKAFLMVFTILMRICDVLLDTMAVLFSQRYFKSLIIPETFYYGEDNVEKRKKVTVQISQSLSYSLLMFGLGFIFTIVYLLVVGGTI